jgi:DNA-binding NtrC family response regulator
MASLESVLDRPYSMPTTSRAKAPAIWRVLVAEDQSDIVAALRLLLSMHDIAVVAAANPADALTIATHQQVDAALIDLNFEKGRTSGDQGLELVSALVKARPHLPIVVMTAWSTSELTCEALRRGARDVIEKPWQESRLVALVRSQIDLGRALRRVADLEREMLELQTGAGHPRGSHAPDLPSGAPVASGGTGAIPNMRLLEVEGVLVRRAMEHHRGNVSRAARTLGLSRSALYRRLERHKI